MLKIVTGRQTKRGLQGVSHQFDYNKRTKQQFQRRGQTRKKNIFAILIKKNCDLNHRGYTKLKRVNFKQIYYTVHYKFTLTAKAENSNSFRNIPQSIEQLHCIEF